jgi:putative ABC transport system substrate-binding protein
MLAITLSMCSEPPATERQTVGVVYTAPHALITEIVKGFRDGLEAEFPVDEAPEVIERHASGDETQYSATIQAMLARRPSLLAPITTPISQIALENKPPDTPMVFLAITDPVGAGLVDSLASPGRSTGVSDLAPFAEILRFARVLYPHAKTLGLPYSPDEQPAVFSREQIEALAPSYGFTIDARPVTSQDELPTLLSALSISTDGLLIGADNKMFEASPLIARLALDARKPFFSGDSTSIKAGALGGYTIDYYQVGIEGAKIAAAVLRGETPGEIPVKVLSEGVLEINQATAEALGLIFPESVTSAAQRIYTD